MKSGLHSDIGTQIINARGNSSSENERCRCDKATWRVTTNDSGRNRTIEIKLWIEMENARNIQFMITRSKDPLPKLVPYYAQYSTYYNNQPSNSISLNIILIIPSRDMSSAFPWPVILSVPEKQVVKKNQRRNEKQSPKQSAPLWIVGGNYIKTPSIGTAAFSVPHPSWIVPFRQSW